MWWLEGKQAFRSSTLDTYVEFQNAAKELGLEINKATTRHMFFSRRNHMWEEKVHIRKVFESQEFRIFGVPDKSR